MNINSKTTKNTLKKLDKIAGGKLTFGRLLWSIRQADGITQVNFSKQLGISKQHLCDIEHNRKSVSPKLAATYAQNLGYAEEQFIRLCLQDMLDRNGINVEVEISKKRHPGQFKPVFAA